STGDERDSPTRASGGHGLIRAFASSSADELSAQNRFAGLGDALRLDDQIGVRTADHEDSRLDHTRGMWPSNFHGSKACSSAQDEKFCFGLSPHAGTPRTRTARAFAGRASCSVNA